MELRQQLNIEIAILSCSCMVVDMLFYGLLFRLKDGLVERLFQWAENSSSPLQAYAAGLLASAMEIPEVASNFREKNAKLVCYRHFSTFSRFVKHIAWRLMIFNHFQVPLFLKRLKTFSALDAKESKEFDRPFAHLSNQQQSEEPSTDRGDSIDKSPDKGARKFNRKFIQTRPSEPRAHAGSSPVRQPN